MLQFTKDQSGGAADMKVGETFEVELPENPTTGYRWYLRSSGGSLLQLQDDSFQASGETTCGAGGMRRWCFRAVQPGSSDFEMEYRRSWEKRPAEAFSLTIRVSS